MIFCLKNPKISQLKASMLERKRSCDLIRTGSHAPCLEGGGRESVRFHRTKTGYSLYTDDFCEIMLKY